jgi:sugar lactone lactonase YvrE
VVTAPGGPSPEPLRVRLRGQGGGTLEVRHRYRLHLPGAGVGQAVAGTEGISVHAVAVTPDGGVWTGGEATRPKAIGTLVQVAADGRILLPTTQLVLGDDDGLPAEAIARIEALTFDQFGRLHALFIARVGQLEGLTPGGVVASGDVVLDPASPDLPCQTVNAFNPAYPLRLDGQASPSVRTVAAGGGDIWLFGSDGGVARVADGFRGGECPEGRVAVRYDPIFRRESGLLTNTVPAFRVGADGALWFGTAVGLVRLAGGQFTPALFEPGLSVGGDVATLEAFFRAVAEAIFEARPLTTVRVGEVSLEEQFGRPLVKADLIFSLAEDPQGRLWVGTLGGGLRRVEARGGGLQDTLRAGSNGTDMTCGPPSRTSSTAPRPLTRREGLGSNLILALAVGPDGSVWAATEEGLSRVQDTPGGLAVTAFSPLDGVPRPVWDVAVAPNGAVWLATEEGLVRLLGRGGGLRGVVVDAQGRPVAEAEVVVAGTAFRAVTDAQGQYVLEDLPPGPAQLVIDGSLAAGGPFTAAGQAVEVTLGERTLAPAVLAPRPPAAGLVKVSGDNQIGVPGAELPEPLVVRLLDQFGTPVAGQPVTAAITEGDGSLRPLAPEASEGCGEPVPAVAPQAREVSVATDPAGQARFCLRVEASGGTIVTEVAAPQLPQAEPVQFFTLEGLISPMAIAVEASAQLVVVDSGLIAVVRVDPVNGNARLVSGNIIGSGPVLRAPVDIAVETVGSLVVVDAALGAVVRVDPVSGDRTIISDDATGRGPPFEFPFAIAVEADGQLVVVDDLRVVRVDPVSGDRTIISGCTEVNDSLQCIGPTVGGGQSFASPVGIAVEANGRLVVTDSELAAVVRVDPVSGDRTLISR